MPRYWSLLDVALIHLRRTELFTTAIPSKMFECMGMGVPVLLGVEGEAAEILNKSEAGLTFEPENAEELAERIKFIKNSPETHQKLSTAGMSSAKEYDRVQLANSMLSVLCKAAGKTNSDESPQPETIEK